jgi:hypothetical protein
MSEAVVCGVDNRYDDGDERSITASTSKEERRRKRKKKRGIEEPKVKCESWRASPEGEGSQARTGPCGRVRGVVVCGPVERS